MAKIKMFFRRYFILSKRLLKRPGFLAILLLVPILVGAMGIAADNGDSGVLTVALAMQDQEDKTAREIVDGLLRKDSLIRFEFYDTSKDAADAVRGGKADAAWIFSSNIEEKIEKFVNHTHKNNAFVAVIQREESVFLRLAHEKLNATLYPYISLAAYREAAGSVIVDISELSNDQIDEFYYAVDAGGEELFDFVYLNGNGALGESDEKSASSFLLSPLRGLLAITVLLAGVAVAMFYLQDEARGAFDRLPVGTGFSFSVIYHASAVIMLGAVVLLALLIMGMASALWYEILSLTLYCVAVVGFCICLRLLLRDIRLFGAAAPLLVVITAVLCPIFFKAPNIPAIQYLLPTYYYVRAFSNSNFIWYMAIYCVLLYAVGFVLHSLRLKQRR